MKMKNHPIRVTLLLLAVFAILLLLRLMPPFELGTVEIKKTDILSDLIKPDGEDDGGEAAMLEALRKQKPAFRDSCPPGMTCIEDYAEANGHGMEPFYRALEQIDELNRPVRIAYFGDSFIEGDIITDELRLLLQKRFGGCGVGFVDMASQTAGFRHSVREEAEGWESFSIVDKDHCNLTKLGISQRYFLPQPGARTAMKGVKKFGCDTCQTATLFLRAAAPCDIRLTLNASDSLLLHARGTGQVEALTAEGKIGRAEWSFPSPAPGMVCWGVALDGRSGITLDNFSLRGSSGTTLTSVPEATLREMHGVRPYDLIVLQYGVNVVTKNAKKYSQYVRNMKHVIDFIKKTFPEAGILICSVGDREGKDDSGTLCTMPGIKAMVLSQQTMAAESGVAFWNLYEGMGGEGSIKRMADAKPAEAGKDYTHINHRGGRRIAGIFYKSIMHGFEQYKKRKAYDEE